ncbi:hypothetical protein COLU111180_14840 [Cohnella lubricantis]
MDNKIGLIHGYKPLRGEFLLKGKLGTLSLACVLGLSSVLFSGCGADTNNNGVNAKNTGRGNLIADNNGNYRSNSLGMNGTRNGMRNGVNGTYRTYGTGNGTNRTFDNGTNGILDNDRNDNDGLFGNARNGLNRIFGNGRNDTNGIFDNGMNGNGNGNGNGLFGANGNGTNGRGTYGAGGTGGGTSGGFHSMSAAGSHVLQLGSLTIVGQTGGLGTNGMNGTGGTTGLSGQNWSNTTSGITGTTGTRPAGSRYNGTGGIGTYSTGTAMNGQTLTVTGSQAVEAIDRVNRALSSPASLSAQSDTLAKDISYILKQAAPTSAAATR